MCGVPWLFDESSSRWTLLCRVNCDVVHLIVFGIQFIKIINITVLIIKPTRCTNSQIYFWNKTLHVSDSSSVHHQEFFTVHTAVVYVIQVCWQLASRIRTYLTWSYLQAVSKPVWHIPLLCVQWKIPDDRQRNCLKYVEFYSKYKFEKLVHRVGFITRIFHDAWSPELQININVYATF